MGHEGACTWQVRLRLSLLSSSFCRAVVKDPGTGLAFAAGWASGSVLFVLTQTGFSGL